MAKHVQRRTRKAAGAVSRKARAGRSAYVMKPEYLAEIERFRLMDDDFMSKCLENAPECIELMLRIIIGKKDLKVVKSQTEYPIKSLQGRGVRFDVFARDSEGKEYDIELQRADKGAEPRRASARLQWRMRRHNDFGRHRAGAMPPSRRMRSDDASPSNGRGTKCTAEACFGGNIRRKPNPKMHRRSSASEGTLLKATRRARKRVRAQACAPACPPQWKGNEPVGRHRRCRRKRGNAAVSSKPPYHANYDIPLSAQ